MNSTTWLVIAAIALAIVIFVRSVRRLVAALIKLCVAVAAIGIAVGGTAILMNNVSINDRPGLEARLWRFLTVDWAATSDKGLSLADCPYRWPGGKVEPAATPAASPTPGGHHARRARRRKAERAEVAASPAATPTPEDIYPELVRQGYPGIPRAKLFELALDTVNELGGWKVVADDRRAFTLDCLYTTRLLHFEDDVRIVVTPQSQIDLCSRSRVGEPDSESWLWFFPGDFGANIGHIRQFYEALEPKADAVYKEQERQMNAGRP